MKVPFLDLKRGYQIYGEELEKEVLKVLRSGIYLNGEKTKELEKTLANYLGTKFAIGVSSGTEALYLILKALSPEQNSFILLPSFTFVSTAEVVVRAGFIPYFVDVEEKTCNISLESLKETLKKLRKKNKKVSGVIAVSLFGIPAELKKIVYLYYSEIASFIHNFFISCYRVDKEKFLNSLLPLLGFSSPDVDQYQLFHRRHSADYSIFMCADSMHSAKVNFPVHLSGCSYFTLEVGTVLLQIRAKPMNIFTAPSLKINCSFMSL